MATAPAGRPGFINVEVTGPVDPGNWEWTIAQRFRDADAMRSWRDSEEHRRLLEEVRAMAAPASDGQALQETEVGDGEDESVVTEVITTYVKPSRDREYLEWARKVHLAEARVPGYRGWFLQPPPSDEQPYWTTLVRFATPGQLDAWLNSDARRDLLREHEALVKQWSQRRLRSSFAGWFPTDMASGKSPPSWKQSMLVLLMLFPIVMLKMKLLSPMLVGMDRSPATFIGNVLRRSGSAPSVPYLQS
jgi:antibiotic biosynthesis monooxygenase (ABM) superfamily enzyme